MTPLELDQLYSYMLRLEEEAKRLGASKSMLDRAREGRVLVSWVMDERSKHDA